MTLSQLEILRAWFDTISAATPSMSASIQTLITLKRTHSHKVAAHCRAIAAELGWTDSRCHLAEALGLLHDTGRFSQIAEYGTFSDTTSIDHGAQGITVFEATGILDTLPHGERECIRIGTRHHNGRSIPSDIAGDSLAFLKLVRDADKLDIFRIIHTAIDTGQITSQPEITLNITLDGPVSPEALLDLRNERSVSYRHITSLADFALTQLSWFYDINYLPTLRALIELDYLERTAALLPSDPDVQNEIELIRRHVKHLLAAGETTTSN